MESEGSWRALLPKQRMIYRNYKKKGVAFVTVPSVSALLQQHFIREKPI